MSATAQQRVIIPARWIVRRSHVDAQDPARGEIVSRQTTESAARRYVRRNMRLHQLRNAYSWPTTSGTAYRLNGRHIYHIEHQSPEEYAREQNERA